MVGVGDDQDGAVVIVAQPFEGRVVGAEGVVAFGDGDEAVGVDFGLQQVIAADFGFGGGVTGEFPADGDDVLGTVHVPQFRSPAESGGELPRWHPAVLCGAEHEDGVKPVAGVSGSEPSADKNAGDGEQDRAGDDGRGA